ncbi:CDP-alcohol phosphatidyltransferase [Methylophaga sp. 41_12_T18]|nr:CDP-alcohol phosphatidyltransferase [Methylophaga sp. 41_12_T18]
MFTLKQLTTIPNLLTCSRFIFAPILLWFAAQQNEVGFLILLMISFTTDVLDGMTARLLNQSSELGAKLDTFADIIIYTTIAISAWWLWPDTVLQQLNYFIVIVVSYLAPIMIGFIKFRALTSYHTWLVKFAVVVVACAFFILFIFGLAWPLHLASLIAVVAAIEEIAITLISKKLQSDIASIWLLLRR